MLSLTLPCHWQRCLNAGAVVPEFDDGMTREVVYTPYRIVYRFDAQRKVVYVSRFWHAARGMPKP